MRPRGRVLSRRVGKAPRTATKLCGSEGEYVDGNPGEFRARTPSLRHLAAAVSEAKRPKIAQRSRRPATAPASPAQPYEEGNDMADKLADYAQKGGAQNEQDIAMIMDGLRATDGED